MAVAMARRSAAIAVVALMVILTLPVPGLQHPAVDAAPTTTIDPRTNPDVLLDEEPLEAQLPDVSFPDTPVNDTSTEDAELVNSGPGDVVVTGTTVSGPGFSLAPGGDGCQGATLGPNQSCTITVTFAPTTPGEFTGELTVTAQGATVPGARLTGTALGGPTTVPPTTGTSIPEVPTSTLPPTSGSVPPETSPENTSPPTSTAPPEIDDLTARIQECVRQVKQVRVRYPRELEMTVRRESEVVVDVTIEGAPAPSTDPDAPDTVEETATLTCSFTAELSGSNFEIDDPIRPGSFVDSPRVSWTWDVIPTATGRHDLDLRITPTFGSGSTATEGTPREFQADIIVTAEPRSAWQIVSDLASDISQHSFFQFAVAAGFVSAIGAAIRKRANGVIARRREQEATEADDDRHDGYL